MTGAPRSFRLGRITSRSRPGTRHYGSYRSIGGGSEFPERAGIFAAFRLSPRRRIGFLRDNVFVERLLPALVDDASFHAGNGALSEAFAIQ